MSNVGSHLKKLPLLLVLALVAVALLGAPAEARGPKKGNGGKGKGKNRPVVEQPVDPAPEQPENNVVHLTSANDRFSSSYALDLDYRVTETVLADPSILDVPRVYVDSFIDRQLSITDQEDVLDLSRIDADETRSGDQAFRLVTAFSGAAGELTMDGPPTGYNNVTQTMRGDTNGDGVADFQIVFIVQGPVILDISDNLVL